MRIYAEITVFAVLAIALHAAGFAAAPETGEDSSGNQGEFLVSLQASTAQLEQMVEEWNAAPDVALEMPSLAEITPLREASTVPIAPESLLPEQNVPSIINPQPTIPSINSEIALPKAATEPAQKPVVEPKPIAVPKVRPKLRPKKVEQAQKPKPVAKPKKVEKPKPKKVETPKPKKKQQTTKKKKKAPAQAGQRKQKAAGQGGQNNAGSSTKAKVKSGASANSAKALDVWGAQIRRSIERRKKSVRGLKRRARVTVSVTVSSSGQILSYRILKSSGNKKADASALRAVNSVGRLPKAVKGVIIKKHTFRVPMIFNP